MSSRVESAVISRRERGEDRSRAESAQRAEMTMVPSTGEPLYSVTRPLRCPTFGWLLDGSKRKVIALLRHAE